METSGKHVDRESQAYARLMGVKKHFCPDWDDMAIDETCPEFDACTCSSPLNVSSEEERLIKAIRSSNFLAAEQLYNQMKEARIAADKRLAQQG